MPAAALLGSGCDSLLAVVSSDLVAQRLPTDFLIEHILPGRTMSASFEAARQIAERDAVDRMLIVLGDMPGISARTLNKLQAIKDRNRACIFQGTRMPPALLLCEDMVGYRTRKGDRGARDIVASLPESSLLELTAEEARDIDHKDDLC